jgi:hypothetical protein
VELSFIQLTAFASNWKRMKLTDDDLRALEFAIATAPDAPPVMRGTGGLRKIRFAPGRARAGKSGGARVCYAYFGEFGLVYQVRRLSQEPEGESGRGRERGVSKGAGILSPLLA